MKKERISNITRTMMMGMAWSVYGLNWIIQIIGDWIGIGLIATTVFMIIAYAMFIMWFTMKGVNLLNPKLAGNFFFGATISAIPVINLFYISLDEKSKIPMPGVCKNISRIIKIVQAEDEQYNKKQQGKLDAKKGSAPQGNALAEQKAKAEKIRMIRERQAQQEQIRENERVAQQSASTNKQF